MSTVIKLENISKQYRLGSIGTNTLKGDLQRWWYNMRGLPDPTIKVGQEKTLSKASNGKHHNEEYIWALKDINFDIKQGEVLGIIGKNGAGKSTLLKLLSRVTAPTTGNINIKGRIASLLEVGTGFHPDLTGRENIFLNGAILGMRKIEIQSKLDEIVDFAGVTKYLDTPVKRYSSGMYVRLAFAVAAHLEPEILIVDEVLAVGDAEFQKKAIGKIHDVSCNEGRTVLFVSHNMAAIQNLCTTAVYLVNGRISFSGVVDECINIYNSSFEMRSIYNTWDRNSPESNFMFFRKANCILNSYRLIVAAEVETRNNCKAAFIAFDIQNSQGATLFQSIPQYDPFIFFSLNPQSIEVEIDLPLLIPDTYFVSLWIGSHFNDTFDWQQNVLKFEVDKNPIKTRLVPHSLKNGNIVAISRLIRHEKNNN